MAIQKSGETRKIAIYGKGGIGKSTTTTNLAAAASVEGLSTMVVGCDPKADSIHMLIKEKEEIHTVLGMVRESGQSFETINKCIYEGFNDIVCVESGGPAPGVGCAGKGVALALELLKEYKFFKDSLDLVIFDVLGDVVCGGFAQPMRAKFAQEVYVVTSGEFMSLYQAINIASSIANLANEGIDVRMAGLICNQRNVEGEDKILNYLSELIEVPLIMAIPRASVVQKAESMGKTVIEAFPDSDQAKVYAELAHRIYKNKTLTIPKVDNRAKILERIQSMIREAQGYEAV